MRIGFVVNDVKTELAAYTTTRLAMAAVNRALAMGATGSPVLFLPSLADSGERNASASQQSA